MPLFLSHELDNKTGKYKIGTNFSGSNYFFTAGYEVGKSPQVKFLPSLLIKYHPDNSIQIDYNVQVLMAGYMNKEALEKTEKEKRVTFFSPSQCVNDVTYTYYNVTHSA